MFLDGGRHAKDMDFLGLFFNVTKNEADCNKYKFNSRQHFNNIFEGTKPSFYLHKIFLNTINKSFNSLFEILKCLKEEQNHTGSSAWIKIADIMDW